MALLTPLSLEAVRRLGALYGLEVAAVRPILAGSVNTNVQLTLASGGHVFLRIYEEQTLTTASGEARLLAHLAARGVRTPCPLPLLADGGATTAGAEGRSFVAEYAGKPAAIFPWIEGHALCQQSITPAVAAEVGEALARIHVAGASFEGAPRSRFGSEDLTRRIGTLRGMPLRPELAAVVEDLALRLDRFTSRVPVPGGSGLVHGDFFRDNVLWSDGSITALLDFESASHESYAFDLMVAILAWCFGDCLDPELSRALAAGYARIRPLPDTEAASLYDEGSFAALRFAITRLTDFELRPRGTGAYKDYRRFLARAAELDALGPKGVRAFLGL